MSSTDYRDDIDGLRALAVSAVVLHHAFPALAAGGFVGVDVFFVISGYLISAILLHELHSGSFSLRAFYARRIRRIFPALTLVLIGFLIAALPVWKHSSHFGYAPTIWMGVMLVAHFYMVMTAT